MIRTAILTASAALALCAPALAQAPAYNQIGDPWYEDAQAALEARAAIQPINKQAKNVILFIADGMDPTTVAAARIYDGQSRGETGEENFLSFERFPWLAMSKTYNTNMQVPDSAGTASAMMTGVKTKAGMISVGDAAPAGDCDAGLNAQMLTIAELAEIAGMSTGVISTARLTHATPATVYAHVANRGWETDSELPEGAASCKDIARQLIEFPYGDGIDVALGGGRGKFLPATVADPEETTRAGERKDGRDLASEWVSKSSKHAYVWNAEQFSAIKASKKPKVLGLFEYSHMEFEADRAEDAAGEPSLAEMTTKSIEILSRNKDGYFLMVEGGKVDHAHHAGNAYRALTDTQAFAAAIAAAREMTDREDTLIIVTADHGHTMAFQGYSVRGNPILGVAKETGDSGEPEPLLARDEKAYTTLTYANGPGSILHEEPHARGDVLDQDTEAPDYVQQALIPTGSETHGGQDVTIYADGPYAHLIGGVVEQNYIYHVMTRALDLEARAGVKPVAEAQDD